MLRRVLTLAVAGLIFVLMAENVQAVAFAPLPPGDAVDIGNVKDVSWRRCWHDRYGNKHCGRCWRDLEGRVHCS